jgi:hypothetical protein
MLKIITKIRFELIFLENKLHKGLIKIPTKGKIINIKPISVFVFPIVDKYKAKKG